MLRHVWTVLVVVTVIALVTTAVADESWGTACASCQTGVAKDAICCGDAPLCENCCECPCLQIGADVMWLGRGKGDPQTLFSADIGGDLFVLADAIDLHPQIGTGTRMDLLARGLFGEDLEASYFGVYDQEARLPIRVDPATANLNSVQYQFFGVTAGNVTSYDIQQSSDLHSVELNLRGAEGWGVTPLVGVRWFEFRDELEISETATPSNGALGRIRNDLAGVQMGAHTTLWNRGGWFDVTATLKAGLYGNRSNVYADTHTAAGATLVLDRNFRNTSFAGEIHLTAHWHMTPHLGLRAGYTGLWLDEISLVSDQIDNLNLNTGLGSLDRKSVSMHGGHLGVELRW